MTRPGRPGIVHAESSEAWLRHTLEEILTQLRALLDIDGCAFQTVDADRGHIRAAATWFETPAVRAALGPVLDRPYDAARGGVTEAAIERGEPLLLSDIQEWEGGAALRARLHEHLPPADAEASWELYRTSSFISCPVRTAGGRTLGVLALSSSPPRPKLTDAELRVTEVFAGLAALALERSELLEREAARAHTEALLHRAAEVVTATLDVERVYRAIVEQAAIVAGAPIAMLLRLDPTTQTLRSVATVGASERLAAHRYAIGDGMVGRAAATGVPYLSNERDAPRYVEWVAREGVRSFVHMPVVLGPRVFGVLSVCHPDSGALDEDSVALLSSFARAAAAAIANALEFAHEQRIAHALTRGYIPGAPPELEGYELGFVYQPAGQEVSGGDLFGAWRLPGGALALLVGDVGGKGLEVAATSAMVRFFVEARTWDSDRPAEVLAQTDAILQRRLPGGIALVTAFLAIVDAGVLRYASAGHVPTLLVGPDGAVRELERTGVPLGVDGGRPYGETEVPFGPADTVFASTDGLVEARRDGEQFGQERLSALVAGLVPRLGPQALVERVHADVEAWADGLTDDVAVLALRPR
jgi:GAF domain-containing protein